jgi:WhiB family redox-sensing transcriptional regulator
MPVLMTEPMAPGNTAEGAAVPVDDYVGPCVDDPERWTTAIDEDAKALCRACLRRWLCAREACEMPGAEGLWAGVVVPESGRGRTFALRKLRSLAKFGGFPPRPGHRRRRAAAASEAEE